MKLKKLKIFSLLVILIILIMPFCNAAKNKSADINEKSSSSIYKLSLILRIIGISIVTFISFKLVDKFFNKIQLKNPVILVLELIIDSILSTLYTFRVNRLLHKILS